MKKFRSDITKIDRSATAPRRKNAYRALLATSILFGSQLLSVLSAAANPMPTPGIPSPLLPTRVLLNGSFEQPRITSWVESSKSSTLGTANTNIAGANVRHGYNEPVANSAAQPIIWKSTESENNRPNPETESQCSDARKSPTTGSRRNAVCFVDAVEVWRNSPGGGAPSHTAGVGIQGSQYAELNGSDNAALYQDLCVVPGETVNWSLRHSARSLDASNVTNIMQVSITDVADWNGGKVVPTGRTGAYYSSTSSSGNTSDRPYIANKFNDAWKNYSGSWTSSTGSSAKVMRFAFGAIQGWPGNPTVGNFIDDVQLSLPALIDFLPTDANNNVNTNVHSEGNDTNYYYLSLRVNGALAANGRVNVTIAGLGSRAFRLGTVKKGSGSAAVNFTGATATANGNTIELTIPPGTYNPNAPGDYIHIPIDFSNEIYQSNANLTFTLEPALTSNLTTQSTRCSTDIVNINVQLTEDEQFQKRVERPVRIATH